MSYKTQKVHTLTAANATATSTAIDVHRLEELTYQWDITDNAPAAKIFVDGDVTVGTDTIAEVAHGYTTGDHVQLTTSGVLPAGLALATDYYIIAVDDDSLQFASSLANALSGTAVDITAAAGTGNHTITAVAIDMVWKLQGSLDNSAWTDLASGSLTVSTSGTKLLSYHDDHILHTRAVLTVTSGNATGTIKVTGKYLK